MPRRGFQPSFTMEMRVAIYRDIVIIHHIELELAIILYFQDEDSRIFVLVMFPGFAVELLCEVRHQNNIPTSHYLVL